MYEDGTTEPVLKLAEKNETDSGVRSARLCAVLSRIIAFRYELEAKVWFCCNHQNIAAWRTNLRGKDVSELWFSDGWVSLYAILRARASECVYWYSWLGSKARYNYSCSISGSLGDEFEDSCNGMLLLVVWLILRGAHVPLDRHFRNSHPRNYSSRIVDPIIFYIVTVSLSVTYFNTSERSCSSVYNVCYLTFMSSTPSPFMEMPLGSRMSSSRSLVRIWKTCHVCKQALYSGEFCSARIRLPRWISVTLPRPETVFKQFGPWWADNCCWFDRVWKAWETPTLSCKPNAFVKECRKAASYTHAVTKKERRAWSRWRFFKRCHGISWKWLGRNIGCHLFVFLVCLTVP